MRYVTCWTTLLARKIETARAAAGAAAAAAVVVVAALAATILSICVQLHVNAH